MSNEGETTTGGYSDAAVRETHSTVVDILASTILDEATVLYGHGGYGLGLVEGVELEELWEQGVEQFDDVFLATCAGLSMARESAPKLVGCRSGIFSPKPTSLCSEATESVTLDIHSYSARYFDAEDLYDSTDYLMEGGYQMVAVLELLEDVWGEDVFPEEYDPLRTLVEENWERRNSDLVAKHRLVDADVPLPVQSYFGGDEFWQDDLNVG